MKDFKSNYITGHDRYVSESGSVYRNISDLIKVRDVNEIDPVSILGILMKNYAIGDRTLVSGISKQPWMSSFYNNKIVQYQPPFHGNESLNEDDVADKLIKLLAAEAQKWLKGKESIGILLSGGMDSRIIASILNRMQKDGLYLGKVTALTWGLEDSRDVVYAKRIADYFGWDFKHFNLSPRLLKDNIYTAGIRGAEYSPVHLHAMRDVSLLGGIDGVLAGSYGDSIGRGEYSGKKVKNLPNMFRHHLNHYAFMSKDIERWALKQLMSDAKNYRQRFPERTELSYREMEMQMHYMRRQLNSCMSVIDENIPLYQMFSAPEVFGFIWSLDFNNRNNLVYEKLLYKVSKELLTIPWARNGKLYNDQNSAPLDNFSKIHHNYGNWLRNDNREFILERISNGCLQSLNIFNEKALKYWCDNWRSDQRNKVDRLDEKMAWLASLSIFVEKYNIRGLIPNKNKNINFNNFISLERAKIYESLYYKYTSFKYKE
ncbi:asparagine synthase-related protein [Vibrio ostreae]|uniref:asparagine synthase (glutamine-hydrolyzing) n=1 Tax=Vibrio ostreae TaxID=2841925 RepID=A0A975YN04_9VIBR|nr:asparagine synthase-related protein [Vibrio ostreae]QXO17238.1 hypothetical protein KNV97_17825 [Vibrio ostreae]